MVQVARDARGTIAIGAPHAGDQTFTAEKGKSSSNPSAAHRREGLVLQAAGLFIRYPLCLGSHL